MKYISSFIIALLLMGLAKESLVKNVNTITLADNSYAQLSMELLQTVRENGDPTQITRKLASVSVEELNHSLDTEEEKKAFWLNVYNAYVQILLGENPELLKTKNDFFGYNFFSTPQVTIAEHQLSFDDLEHGIMRRSKIKLSLGYMDKWGWWIDDFEQRFRWKKLDPRVHFALNCGAASCPKIAVYDPGRVNEQLNITAREYLQQTTDYSESENTAEVTRLFSWFRGDFGGLDGVLDFLKKYDVLPQDAHPEIQFKEYDWTVDLGNYKDI